VTVEQIPARPEPEGLLVARLADAASPAERIDAFVALVRALRAVSGEGRRSGLARLVEDLEASPELGEKFRGGLALLLTESDATDLLGSAGIPGHRGFLAEFGDRLSSRFVPAARSEVDFARVAQRLFRSAADVDRFKELPLDLFHRAVRLAWGPPGAWEKLEAAFTDGFRLLIARVRGEGLSPKIRARGTPGRVADSPFYRIGPAGDALLAAWTEGHGVAEAAQAFRRVAGECRKEARLVEQHLERAGVSVDIVFSLEVIDRCLTRMALMAEVLEAPEGPERSRAIHRLLARLFHFTEQDRSLAHLFGWNLHLLGRKIVDRSGEAGEHYIAADRKEYRHIWAAAAGGGLLTVGTAAVKAAVHGWHLPPGPEGLLYGLNYALSFVLLQHLGLILATKQPAMTAAHLARILRDSQGADREERVAETFSRLASSQLAAALANVLAVAFGALVFDRLLSLLLGRSWLGSEEALDIIGSLSPVDSGTVFYAALTGVLLWLASVAGGWFDNWAVYHRIPEGIAQHPLGRTFGPPRMKRAADLFARNASGWATNVSLGFLLGMTPAIGRFTGLPLDVRHVTLNTGILSIAGSSLGSGWYAEGWFLRATTGIGVMFVLNLSVSFACSLLNAARAYDVPREELLGILRRIGRRVLRSPLEFVRPPRTAVPAAGDEA
jgi:site-specific recombinase